MNKPDKPTVSVIIPAYNEEKAVASQVEQVRRVLDQVGYEYEIIVVDDGSGDETAAQALAAQARVFRHPENRGYGMSLKTGIVAAQYETIAIIDADGTYPVEEIPTLVTLLEEADMVVGARIGSQVHVSRYRQPAKWFLRKFAERIAEQAIPDLNSGLRVFRRTCVRQYFAVLSNRFSFTTTVTLAYLADNYRVVYHPINYYPRIGRSKIVPRHFMDFAILIIRMSMMFNPLKVFVPLALTFGVLGVIKMIYDIFALFARSPGQGWELLLQPVLSTSAVLLLFVGLQLMILGMVADGVIRRIGQFTRQLAPSHGYVSYEIQADLESAGEDRVDIA
ncbi:MAG: glycosyltransferase family 2 protein [Anaerolineales bacterium]|jgi:glycosyltransferase involved in cell wall biosynthesis|nr:glycosyltransferase family 2 protein [Anaerolineales bacterium]